VDYPNASAYGNAPPRNDAHDEQIDPKTVLAGQVGGPRIGGERK
jgi:hypothetical protein